MTTTGEPENGVVANDQSSLPSSAPKSHEQAWIGAISVGVLLFLLVGSLLYPSWWYEFLFRGKVLEREHWVEGLTHLREYYLWPTIVVLAMLVAVVAGARRLKSTRVQTLLKRTPSSIHAMTKPPVVVVLTLVTALSFVLVYDRESKSAVLELNSAVLEERRDAELRQWLESARISQVEKPPLSQPTSFIYLSPEVVESLYSQYEDELVPAKVIEELSTATGAKAGVSVQVVSGEVSKNDIQRKTAEYRETPRTPERKLKDLVQFLYKSDSFRRFGDFKSDSSEVTKLDEATRLLQTHSVSIDRKALTSVRDRLLSKELAALQDSLKSARGLLLIEGDWQISVSENAYTLTRAFVSDVTASPTCEVRIPKVAIKPGTREVLDALKSDPLRVTVFGNIVVGVSQSSNVVRLDPIAVY